MRTPPSSLARFHFSLCPASAGHKEASSAETEERFRLLENKKTGNLRQSMGWARGSDL